MPADDKTKQLEEPTKCCHVRLLVLIPAINKYSCPCGETKIPAQMRYPPLKAIEAVKTRRIDGRTKHIAVRFRNFFQCLDGSGNPTSDEAEIVKITLTRQGEEYWEQNNGGKQRIPAAQA